MCRGIPFIQLGGEPASDIPAVIFDQAEGQRQLMEHLYAGGHRKIAEISGPLVKYDGRVRHNAYLDWMSACGLEAGPWVEGNFTSLGGYALTHQLLDKGDFTALVCGNDESALGALRALRERGLRVPDDISVVGFDDYYAVQFNNPPLTTMRQDYPALSRFGIENLIAPIEDPGKPGQHLVLQPQLVVRESTRILN